MSKPRILVINPCHWSNKGDVTNRLGLIFALKKMFPNEVSISIESATPDQDSSYFSKYGVKVVKGLFVQNKDRETLLKYTNSLLSFSILFLMAIVSKISNKILVIFRTCMLNSSLWQTFLEYYSSDLVISAPGGFLSDNYIFSSLIPNLLEIFLAKLLSKPVIIYSQSIGPFRSKLLAYLTGFILNTVDVIILRERKSKFWLKKMYVKKPRVYVTADATFSLDATIASRCFVQKSEHRTHTLSVGITLATGWVSNLRKTEVYKKYLVTMANFIDYIIEKLRADVYILPQVADLRDFEAAYTVRKLVRNKSKLFIDVSDYSPEDLMRLIGCMDLLIGTRMHSNIFALLMEVPVICISYEHKGEGIMEMMGLEKFVINLYDLTLNGLVCKLNDIMMQKQSLKEFIRRQVQNMHERSNISAKIVKCFWDYSASRHVHDEFQ